MATKKADRNSPKTLTTKQSRFVAKLVEKFGEKYTGVKRGELKKAAQEILGSKVCPAWITRNMNVRISGQRGMYNLSHLCGLPVADPEPQEKKKPVAEKSETSAPVLKKAAAKKAPAKKKKEEPKPPVVEEVEEQEETEGEEDGE